jgi:FlaA1/EpsC-like NDP-sugar epimerase
VDATVPAAEPRGLACERLSDQASKSEEMSMKSFTGRTAVITGAASGFGLEVSRIAANKGMAIVMADIQQDALDAAVAEIAATTDRLLSQLPASTANRDRPARPRQRSA